MTGQIPDIVWYQRRKHELIGVEGDGLFDPRKYDVEPVMMHTACYRGFICSYRVKQKQLILSELELNAETDTFPAIGGVTPELETGAGMGIASYTSMEHPILFTGRLRLGAGFIREHYIHMGFQKPSAYETVMELEFDEGILLQAEDRSEYYADKRGEFKERYRGSEVVKGIDEAFSLDLDLE